MSFLRKNNNIKSRQRKAGFSNEIIGIGTDAFHIASAKHKLYSVTAAGILCLEKRKSCQQFVIILFFAQFSSAELVAKSPSNRYT